MAKIHFEDVCVDFPVYNADSRSLKKRLIQVATGGRVDVSSNGKVYVRSLDRISFKFHDGDRIGVLGHNGAGKSTLLRLLTGVYHPSSGRAEVQGEIGSLIDISLGIDPEATGRDNVYYRGALLGIPSAVLTRRMDEIIDFSELGDFIDMPIRTYSTGMHLRLAFAISTLVQPEILLMDEWLSVGDEGFRQKANARLHDFVRSSSILVIASHSRELILDNCTRVIWLEHGRIRMDGDPVDVCNHYFGQH